MLFSTCSSTILTAQIITGVNPNAADAGQTVNVIITGSNTNFTTATGAHIYRQGWDIHAASFTANSNTNMTATFNIPPNAQLGLYDLQVHGAFISANAFSVQASQTGSYGYISGKVIHETGTPNCIWDGSDGPIPNKIVEILPGPYYVNADPVTGEYGLWVPLGNYTVSTFIPNYQGFQCPSTGNHSVNLTVAGDTVLNRDFFIYDLPPPPVHNLRVYSATSPHRPGFQAYTRFTVRNIGNQPTTTTTLTATVSGAMFHLSESPTASSVTSTAGTHTMTWSVPPTMPGDILHFYSFDSLPASIPLGTSLPNTASINYSDDNLNDNSYAGSRFVTGSYDPNDKQVWTQDEVDADGFIEQSDTLLRYLIRCQNTGTDTAFNIYIRDTLDPNLDINTLQVIDASHSYQVSVSGPGYVQFTFPNILLVDSTTNEPESHGYIEYTIQPLPNLPIGTQIDNTAHIYFDFNAPVVTNTVSSIICPEIEANYGSSISTMTVSFTDSSTGTITGYVWDFGDGTTSTAQSPTHTYTNPGLYNVCLSIVNSCGRTDTVCTPVTVGCGGIAASFASAPNMLSVNFTDQSNGNPTAWQWDFGDGNTSTQQNPTHSYTAPGTYTVCLISTTNCGDDTVCTSVTVSCPAPSSAFGSTVSQLQASFSDMSTGGATSWMWDFGDGNTSTQQNPTHSYTASGTYTVCLIASSLCGSDTICNNVTVTCQFPNALFYWNANEFEITFNDLSTFGTSWMWDFGDGNTSTQQSPTHTYASTGIYTVCLITTNACGNDTNCANVEVTCNLPNSVFFWNVQNLNVAFANQTNNATTYFWDFGDGNTSTQQNPTHTYNSDGNYTVCLVSTNDCGSDTNCSVLTVTCPLPVAGFNAQGSGLTYSFGDNSTGATSWTWDFGDGNTSNDQTPNHTFGGPGLYTVCQIAQNDCGMDTTCQNLDLTVGVEEEFFSYFGLSPNPTLGTVTLELILTQGVDLKLHVFDAMGRTVSYADAGKVAGSFQREIDLGDQAAGIYFLRLDVNGKAITRKIVKK